MDIDSVQSILTTALPLLLVGYAVTTGIMYLTAKCRGYNPVEIHVKSRWDVNLDLKFLSDMRKSYIAAGKPKVIPLVNLISFYGFFVCLLLVISMEFMRY